MKRLHLGCGQRYFEGYVNIDYPLTEHTVQTTSVADEFHDLLALNYAPSSIDEIRLHHVFEHFTRAQAAALLGSWNAWLKRGGILHIEVPDVERTARAAFGMLAGEKALYVGLRHIFGSQEAHSAVHYEGYSKKTLTRFLERFGFSIQKVLQEKWKDTYNISVIAKKERDLDLSSARAAAKEHLSQYMVDDGQSESVMLEVWLRDLDAQLNKTFPAR